MCCWTQLLQHKFLSSCPGPRVGQAHMGGGHWPGRRATQTPRAKGVSCRPPLTQAQHRCPLSSSTWQHDQKQHSECFINKYNTYALYTKYSKYTKYTKYTKYSMRTVQYKFMFTVLTWQNVITEFPLDYQSRNSESTLNIHIFSKKRLPKCFHICML